ncbi:MAG TPA: helix-turn-helix transcriptional regulator [Solirubrobacteraceae bacterium]|nr:helix-turn-helix transcriptional regulator [Solirubrobacteraceae bacterium]
MKLRPVSYLLLGMVRLGARSGYAIKKAADLSTHAFWPTSLAQVYPELGRLEQAGLLARREDPRGARARAEYSLTALGSDSLLTWLSSTREPPTKVRDEGLLRLFFADALGREEQIAMVTRMAASARAAAAEIAEQVLPTAEAVEDHGNRFPLAVARFGADVYAYSAAWLDGLRQELEAAGEEDEPRAGAGREGRATRQPPE